MYAWGLGIRMSLRPRRADNLIIRFPSNFLDIRRIAIILYACYCDDTKNSFPPSDMEKCAFWEKSYGYWQMQQAWKETKPAIDGVIRQTLPRGANFTEWHAHMYDVEMISDMSEHQNDIVPLQTTWNFSKKWWKNDENRRKLNSKFHKNTTMLLPDIGCIFPPKMK